MPKVCSIFALTAFTADAVLGVTLSSSKKFFDVMVRSVVLMGVTACNVAARVLAPHRHPSRRAGIRGVDLPDTWAARGQTLGSWCAGAVGAFSVLHVGNGRFFYAVEPLNCSQQS